MSNDLLNDGLFDPTLFDNTLPFQTTKRFQEFLKKIREQITLLIHNVEDVNGQLKSIYNAFASFEQNTQSQLNSLSASLQNSIAVLRDNTHRAFVGLEYQYAQLNGNRGNIRIGSRNGGRLQLLGSSIDIHSADDSKIVASIDNTGILTLTNPSLFFAQTDVGALWTHEPTMGLMSGGIVTSIEHLIIEASPGYGYIEIHTSMETHLKKIKWNQPLQLQLPPNSLCYVYVNEQANLTYSFTKPNTINILLLARVKTLTERILFIDECPVISYHPGNFLEYYLRNLIGPLFLTGGVVTFDHQRQLFVSAASYVIGFRKFHLNGSPTIPLTFFLVYHQQGTYFFDEAFTHIVPNDVYDNGTNLLFSPSLSFTVHTLYVVGEGTEERYFLVVGNAFYMSLLEAQSAPLPPAPDIFIEGVVCIASLITSQADPTFLYVQSERPLAPSISGLFHNVNTQLNPGMIDHGTLMGLLDDTHPQYFLANGMRPMSGDINLDGYKLLNGDYSNISVDFLGTNESTPLRAAKGGTGFSSFMIGDTLSASSSTSLALIRGNKTTTRMSYFQVGDGINSSLPYWDTIQGADIMGDISGKSSNVTGIVLVANGGTGISTYASGDLLYGISNSTQLGKLNAGAVNTVLLGTGSIPTYGKVDVSSTVTGTLPVANGGTGQTMYASGDLLYGIANSAQVGKLTAGAVNTVLLGTGSIPTYGKVDLTSTVTGTLPVTNGGTGLTNAGNPGSILYANATNGYSSVSGAANQILCSQGINAPTFKTLVAGANIQITNDTNNITIINRLASGAVNSTTSQVQGSGTYTVLSEMQIQVSQAGIYLVRFEANYRVNASTGFFALAIGTITAPTTTIIPEKQLGSTGNNYNSASLTYEFNANASAVISVVWRRENAGIGANFQCTNRYLHVTRLG